MRKIIISESQLSRLIEANSYSPIDDEEQDDNGVADPNVVVKKDKAKADDIVNTHTDKNYWKWLVDDLSKISSALNTSIEHVAHSLKAALSHIQRIYGYDLKRVIVTDSNDNVVGYLIWAKEGRSIDDIGDGNEYPVIIATAIAPKYRGKGLFTKMLNKSNIKKPFLVQLNPFSPTEFWNKVGCSSAKEVGQGNYIGKCN